jgi:hypothetical protein
MYQTWHKSSYTVSEAHGKSSGRVSILKSGTELFASGMVPPLAPRAEQLDSYIVPQEAAISHSLILAALLSTPEECSRS